MKNFREGYEYPVLFGLFKQRLAEEQKEKEADDEGKLINIPDDYVRGERARMARAVLMAMEPEIHIAEGSAT
jgi:energy-coupling factor transporter ATP-binding protein EcfA2